MSCCYVLIDCHICNLKEGLIIVEVVQNLAQRHHSVFTLERHMQHSQSGDQWSRSSVGSRGSRVMALIGAGVSGMLGLAGVAYADEAEHGLQAPMYPWVHDGWFSSYDHASSVPLTLPLFLGNYYIL